MADKNWNEKLRLRMAEYEQTPPEGLWEAVEAGLPQQKAAAFPWMWALAAVAAVVLAVVLLWRPASGPVPSDPAKLTADVVDIAESAPSGPVAADPSVSADPSDHSAPSDLSVASAPSASSATARSATVPAREDNVAPSPSSSRTENVPSTTVPAREDNAAPSPSSSRTETVPQTEPTPQPTPQTDPTPQPTPAPQPEPTPKPAPTPRIDIIPAERSSSSSYGGLTASLVGGAVPGAATDSYVSYGQAGLRSSGNTSAKSAPVALLSRNRETTTDKRYSIAFRVGLMLNVPLSRHWGVETGVQLSQLQNQTKSVTGNMTTVTDGTIAYIGVPVLAVYTPWTWDRVSVYASAGPMFEYGFRNYGKQKSYMGTDLVSDESFSDKVQDIIWSAGANVGVQWLFTRHGGLFLQPGISWHFAGNNNTESYYTEHPLAFSVAAGVRLTF